MSTNAIKGTRIDFDVIYGVTWQYNFIMRNKETLALIDISAAAQWAGKIFTKTGSPANILFVPVVDIPNSQVFISQDIVFVPDKFQAKAWYNIFCVFPQYKMYPIWGTLNITRNDG